MELIAKLFRTSFFTFALLKDVSATTALDTQKIGKFNPAWPLQYDEVEALVNYLSSSGTSTSPECASCPKNAAYSIQDGKTCDLLKGGSFCADLQTCVDADCPEDCHDEVHALMSYYLKEVGCSGNECPPGFKVKVTIASAFGAVLIGWMTI